MARFRAGLRMSKDLFCLNQDQDPFRAAYNCVDDSTGDCNLLFFSVNGWSTVRKVSSRLIRRIQFE